MLRISVAAFIPAFVVASVAPARGQDQSAPSANSQIELNLINLPTTRSIERHKGYARFTHRFARDLGLGDFGDLAADLFSLDNGAVIGLEYRFGITNSLQAGVHRNTSSKTLQLFSRWDLLRQGGALPLGVSALASVEGLDNMQEGRQPALGIVASFTHGQALALYVTPMFVNGTRDAELLAGGTPDHYHDHFPAESRVASHEGDEHADHEGTLFVGLGARVRVLPSMFVVGEVSPRLAGHDPGDAGWGVSVEKWTGGHTLALTLTNFFGTTPGQIARGGDDTLHLGFNITRRF